MAVASNVKIPLELERELVKQLKKTQEDLASQEKYKNVVIERSAKEIGNIILPADMTLTEAARFIQLKIEDEEKIVQVNERIEGFPLDVAHALGLAVGDLFGFRELRTIPGGFFRPDQPPSFQNVPTDAFGGMVEVFTGRFGLPGMEDGWLQSAPDDNNALWITGKLAQKYMVKVRLLLDKTRKYLEKNSLYKGKAFEINMESKKDSDGDIVEDEFVFTTPQFLDLRNLPANLMLNDDTMALVSATVFHPLSHPDLVRRQGIPLKRTILLEGPPGTGKTLTGLAAARMATEFGWTVLYLKDVSYLEETYRLATRYAPALVIAEDLDKLVEEGGDMNAINNVLDGLDTKDKEVQLVLTTNYIKKIPKITLRMGRVHVLVHYDLPDDKTATALVEQFGGENIDYNSFDRARVGYLLEGSQPSTIRETLDRAMLLAGSTRGYGNDYAGSYMIGTREIELAVRSLKDHRNILETETPPDPSVTAQFGDVVGRHLVEGLLAAAGKIDDNTGYQTQSTIKRRNKLATEPSPRLLDGAASLVSD